MKHNYNKIGFHSLSLNVTLWILCVLMYACGSGGGSGSEGGVGSISFDFVLATPQRSGVVAGQQPNQAEFPCEENEVETIEAQVFDENEVLLAEGGPWPCADGEGVISDVEAGDNRIVKIFARNSEGDIVFAGRSEPFSVQAGETTRVGTIELVPASLIPVTNEDTAITDEDQDVIIAVLDNDSDPYYNPSGDYFGTLDPTTVAVVSNPTSGNTEVNADGTVKYMPDGNSNGADSFTYTVQDDFGATSNETLVTVTVNPVNDPPVANDQAVVTDEDNAVGITVTGSDVDVGDTLTFSVVGGPAHGFLNGTAPNLTYTPDANYHGADSFTFKANDGSADSNVATVTITVIAVNDAPVANDQADVTDEDSTVGITVTGSDVDVGDTLTFSVVGGPAHGSFNGTAPNLIYMPDANFHGADSFTFKANDGSADSNVATVTITVIAVNDAPVANDDPFDDIQVFSVDNALDVLANDSDPVEGDPLIITAVDSPTSQGGLVTINSTEDGLLYTPASGFFGTDTFTYTITDVPGGSLTPLTDTALVTVNVTATITRVSVATGDVEATGDSTNPSISADGLFVAFDSTATDLVIDDTNNDSDIFVHNLTSSTTVRVSVDSNGNQATSGDSVNPSISSDGRFVAFESDATNLGPPDSGDFRDIFVNDRDTDENGIFDEPGAISTERVSNDSGGGEANGSSFNPSISADGLIVAFESTASDLVSGDGNFASDIFVRDRSADPPSTVRISVDENGFDANGGSFNPSVSADGLIVAFESTASDLVSGDGNFDRDIFVRDRSSVPESTVRVSVDIADGDANDGSFNPSISADGRFVAFVSLAENLVGTDDTNGFADVFVRDLDNDTTRLVSVSSGGTQGDGHSGGIEPDGFSPDSVSISSGGRFVVFGSEATNLLDVADTNGAFDIFLHDRDTNNNGIFDEPGFISTVRASVAPDGSEANDESRNPSIDPAGRFVAFSSIASNLVENDENDATDIFETPNPLFENP